MHNRMHLKSRKKDQPLLRLLSEKKKKTHDRNAYPTSLHAVNELRFCILPGIVCAVLRMPVARIVVTFDLECVCMNAAAADQIPFWMRRLTFFFCFLFLQSMRNLPFRLIASYFIFLKKQTEQQSGHNNCAELMVEEHTFFAAIA